jgi:hypothetical protein
MPKFGCVQITRERQLTAYSPDPAVIRLVYDLVISVVSDYKFSQLRPIPVDKRITAPTKDAVAINFWSLPGEEGAVVLKVAQKLMDDGWEPLKFDLAVYPMFHLKKKYD